jgi:hypothetical protein
MELCAIVVAVLTMFHEILASLGKHVAIEFQINVTQTCDQTHVTWKKLKY